MSNVPGARPGTCTSADYASYQQALRVQRAAALPYMGYDDHEYRRPALAWTQSSYVQTQLMVHDRFFFDPTSRRYTVDRYLDDLTARYGGIDSVLVWPTYPNLGIDDRNQYDMVRALPGGESAVRDMVADFHRRGVRVLLPEMPWDQGTRAEGVDDPEALARELASVGADGINGDTMSGIPSIYRAATDSTGHGIALEPELGMGALEELAWNVMGWGYWTYDFVPSVDKFKWYEARHMTHLSRRSARNHTDDLQEAFFNGIGFESWENVWGEWNPLSVRDAEALRRMAAIERMFDQNLVSADWSPHVPTEQFGVFASRWPLAAQTLWTLVNRNAYDLQGAQLRVRATPGVRYFDLWHGTELKAYGSGDEKLLEFDLEANGFGAILATVAPDAELRHFLAHMRSRLPSLLRELSNSETYLPQTLSPPAKTHTSSALAAGMIAIPADTFRFQVNGIEIEGDNRPGVDVQYPWEAVPHRYHDHLIAIRPFWIDRYPVTNAQFKRFVEEARYRPADSYNFLKDWKGGDYPVGWGNKPVTWVSREDASAYATWAGKRLPTEWEWQYAAQGTDGRPYPWGTEWREDAAPIPDRGRSMRPPADVDAHPEGNSPFGVADMVGNIWQWTDEFADLHTRAAIVRGGSHYQPQGSTWYFPQAYRLTQHGKYLLMTPSLDRSGAIGFRCATDSVGS
jgi:iron(II)-dependent oxidoreductase